MRTKILSKSIPLWILLASMAVQGLATYGAVQTIFVREISAYGAIHFTGEVEILGCDIQDERHVSVSLRRTESTELGAVYLVTVATPQTSGQATVTWSEGDPDAKKLVIELVRPIEDTVTLIKIRVEKA